MFCKIRCLGFCSGCACGEHVHTKASIVSGTILKDVHIPKRIHIRAKFALCSPQHPSPSCSFLTSGQTTSCAAGCRLFPAQSSLSLIAIVTSWACGHKSGNTHGIESIQQQYFRQTNRHHKNAVKLERKPTRQDIVVQVFCRCFFSIWFSNMKGEYL